VPPLVVAIVVALQVPVVTVPKVTILVLPVQVASNLLSFKLIKLLSISEFVRGNPLTVAPVPEFTLVVIAAIYGVPMGFTIYLLFRIN
jgi:hypothetical protein